MLTTQLRVKRIDGGFGCVAVCGRRPLFNPGGGVGLIRRIRSQLYDMHLEHIQTLTRLLSKDVMVALCRFDLAFFSSYFLIAGIGADEAWTRRCAHRFCVEAR